MRYETETVVVLDPSEGRYVARYAVRDSDTNSRTHHAMTSDRTSSDALCVALNR